MLMIKEKVIEIPIPNILFISENNILLPIFHKINFNTINIFFTYIFKIFKPL